MAMQRLPYNAPIDDYAAEADALLAEGQSADHAQSLLSVAPSGRAPRRRISFPAVRT